MPKLESIFYSLSIVGMLLMCSQQFFGNSSATAQNTADIARQEIAIKAINAVMMERIEKRNKEFEEIRIRLTHIEDALGVNR